MIKERMQNIFRDVFDDPALEIWDGMTAGDVDEWDSLSHVQLVIAVEKEFKVRFSTADIIALNNVGEFISLVGKQLNQ